MKLHALFGKKPLSVLAVLLLVSGCGAEKPDYVKAISVNELRQVLQSQDIFLVDVHTPQQKHIKGTDVFIPYDEIDKYPSKLPTDKNTAIYLYCESGRMANIAAKALYGLGYRNLTNLEGGAKEWRKSGFEFE